MKRGWFLLWLYGITALVFVGTAYYGSRAVTTLAENTPIQRSNHILIDPGHGGVDGGATSCSGKTESAYNLEISLRLKDLFLFLGADTRMTRDSDRSLHTNGGTIAQKKASDLKERVRLANDQANTVLLSIHQNYYPDERYSGAQVFYPKTQGSDHLAEQLQEAFRQGLNPSSKRQCEKSSGVYLMEHIRCTGVLIECGFLSNQAETAALTKPDYQKKLCAIIAATVSQFLSNT